MLLLLFIHIIFLTCAPVSSMITYTLKSVHVVFRNGDSIFEASNTKPDVRHHLHNLDPPVKDDFSKLDDPNNPHEFDPHVQAMLTKAGKMRSYKLGQYLRSRYSDFLGAEYRRSDVYARSTYPERARASLLLVLAGLYPPPAKQRWNPDLEWQPIPIESPNNQTNDPLMWPLDCPAYIKESKQVHNSPQFVNEIDRMVNFFVLASNISNLGPDELNEDALADLYRKLWTGQYADVPAAKWADVYIPAKIIRNAAVLRYHTENYNNRLRRLNGGILLKKIVDDIKDTIKGEKKTKINLYSGLEFNIVALLWALGAWEPSVPTYSSAVIIELLQIENRYLIKVLYHDGYTGETAVRRIDGCVREMCPFEQFVQQGSAVLPVGMHECYIDSHSNE